MRCPAYEFLSTPSARRATKVGGHGLQVRRISIHALREEGDSFGILPMLLDSHFYPRPPRGGRRTTPAISWHMPYFYPRPPRGGRQIALGHFVFAFRISIHALREEGDSPRSTGSGRPFDFYPPPPLGGRRPKLSPPLQTLPDFYPRPPRGGRPLPALRGGEQIRHFYPRPPRGGRPSCKR